jgi:hypothetical protein
LTYIPVTTSIISNKSISSWPHWNFIIWSSIIVVCAIVGKKSLLLKNLNDFFTELNDTFGEIDRVQTATTKFRSLRHGSCPASVYATDFRQQVCDINCNDNALIGAF